MAKKWMNVLRYFGMTCLMALCGVSIIATGGGGGGGGVSESTATKYTLTVDKFGQGTVTDNNAAIDCGESCSGTYAEGNEVTLRATPTEGWTLHHWSGCDQTDGDSCTVAMNSNKAVYPTFGTLNTTVKSNVIVLDDATLLLLKERAGSTFIFDISAINMAALNVGDVIVSLSGNGFARKVSNVSVLEGSAVLIETTQATLEDIIQDGTIIYNENLSVSELQSSKPLIKGARLKTPFLSPLVSSAEFTIEINHVLYDEDGNEETDDDQARLVGDLTFTFEPDFAFSVNWTGVDEFKSVMHITDSSNLKVEVGTSVPFIEKELKIWEFIFAPIPAGPVLLVPQIEIKLKLKGEASVEVSSSISYSETTSVGLHYRKSTGWQTVNEYKKETTYEEPTYTGTVSLKGGVGAETSIMIYDVVGPNINFESYLKTASNQVLSGSEAYIDWGLYFGVSASAGAEIEVPLIGWSLARFDANLFDYEWMLIGGKNGIYADTEEPTTPINPKATTLSSSKINLTWDECADNVRVDRYFVYRDGKIFTEMTNTAFDDTGLKPATTYCYSVSAVDTSGNESPRGATVCAKTYSAIDNTPPTKPTNLQAVAISTSAINLTWNASTDANGCARYIVYRNGLPVFSTGDTVTTANDTSLKPDTQYCYEVSAVDVAGNESLKSSIACATTKATGEGAWHVYMKCQDFEYNLYLNLDMDETVTTLVQANGTGNDYGGGALAYVITGTYLSSTKTLNGKVTMTFEGNNCVRVDEFQASLGSADTGDITMDQTSVCGCTAQIRFTKTAIAINGAISSAKLSAKTSGSCPGFGGQSCSK